MSSDPQSPDGESDPEEFRNTRVIRSTAAAAATVEWANVGTVIGRTRLAGNLDAAHASASAPFAKTQLVRGLQVEAEPAVGWIVVVKGSGKGAFRPVFAGLNTLGRASSQRIAVDFGDESISREEHAFIAYDDETRSFHLQHGGKANLVRHAGTPVLAPVELKHGDHFRIGNTTFRFVALCGSDFDWTSEVDDA